MCLCSRYVAKVVVVATDDVVGGNALATDFLHFCNFFCAIFGATIQSVATLNFWPQHFFRAISAFCVWNWVFFVCVCRVLVAAAVIVSGWMMGHGKWMRRWFGVMPKHLNWFRNLPWYWEMGMRADFGFTWHSFIQASAVQGYIPRAIVACSATVNNQFVYDFYCNVSWIQFIYQNKYDPINFRGTK